MELILLVAISAVVGIIVIYFLFFTLRQKNDPKEKTTNSGPNGAAEDAASNESGDKAAVGKGKTQLNKKKVDAKASVFTHEWLAGMLKGHGDSVLDLDFSSNGKYMISCAEDRSIMMWSTKDFGQKDHKFVRGRVELDHASHIKMSPDNRAFIVSLAVANTVRVFKMGKKDDGTPASFSPVLDFPTRHKADIINIGIASNGKFIMTSSRDTVIVVWDLKGEVLASIDTLQVSNTCAAVSPCGRFVASSGFTSDVKVWEVSFDKAGNFREVRRAFELKGHTASVHSFSFNNDSTRMATVSKDGTWKVWDTNVDYQRGQEPYLLKTGHYATGSGSPALVALSPDGRTVATATGNDISVFNADTTLCEISIKDAFSAPPTRIEFDTRSRYLVAAGDKAVYLFHNVCGLRGIVLELEAKVAKATSPAMRERLGEQIAEARKVLEEIGLPLSS